MRTSTSPPEKKPPNRARAVQDPRAQRTPELPQRIKGAGKIYATLRGRSLEEDIAEYLGEVPSSYRHWRQDK